MMFSAIARTHGAAFDAVPTMADRDFAGLPQRDTCRADESIEDRWDMKLRGQIVLAGIAVSWAALGGVAWLIFRSW